MNRWAAGIIFSLLASMAHGESISYEIYSFMGSPEGQLIARGTKEYALSDIEVTEKEYMGEIHWTKVLELEDGFKIGTSIYRETEITGFGLWAKQTPCGFSWEWFNASGPGKYNKLQEGGSISVEYHESNGLKEIVTVRFDMDISLRLDEERKEIDGITHRILVKKGSVLKFSPDNALQRTVAQSRPCH